MSLWDPVDAEEQTGGGSARFFVKDLPPTVAANESASGWPISYTQEVQRGNLNLPAPGPAYHGDSPSPSREYDGGAPAPDHPEPGGGWIEKATLPDLFRAEREAHKKVLEGEQTKLAKLEEKYWKELNRWYAPLLAMAIPTYGHNLQQRGQYIMSKDDQIRRDYFAKLERIPQGHFDPNTGQYFAPMPGGGVKVFAGPGKRATPLHTTDYDPETGIGYQALLDPETKQVSRVKKTIRRPSVAGDVGETPDAPPPEATVEEDVVSHVPGPDRTKGPERTTLTVGNKQKQFWVQPGKPSVPVEGDEGHELPAKPVIKTPEQQKAWAAATQLTRDQAKAESLNDAETAYRQQENYQRLLTIASGKSIEKPGEKPPDVANWKFDSARNIYYQNFPTGEGGAMVRWNWDPNAVDPKTNKRGAPVPHVGSMTAHAQKKK